MEINVSLLQLMYALVQNFTSQSFLTPFQVIRTREASHSKFTQAATIKHNGMSLSSCYLTLTVMQGFREKKRSLRAIRSPLLRATPYTFIPHIPNPSANRTRVRKLEGERVNH